MPEKSKGKAKRKSSKKGTGATRFFRAVGIIILVMFALSILMPILYKWVNPPITPLMVIRKVQNGGPIEHEWVPLENISSYMVRCAIASEDGNFLGHSGFDYIAINQAIQERESGRRKRGASTISQQTAKNVFLWPKSSWVRKGFESYFTFMIEHIWGKERIMEVYLNVIEMGPGIYGAEAAAEHYFHTTAERLTLRQSALITACYPAPLKRSASNPSSYVRKRASQVQAQSGAVGRVSFDEESIAKAHKRYEARSKRAKEKVLDKAEKKITDKF